jgi:hypothetical protein
MMMKHLLLLCLVCISFQSFAQNRISDHNTIGWYAINIDPAISKKWSAHIEYQWRREDVIVGWQQSLLRLGLTHKISPQVSVQAGYAWIVTPPYGEIFLAGVRKPFPEHRIYEQLVATGNLGKVKLTNRLRIEQRFNGRFESEDDKDPEYVYVNRIRYMPRIDVPLDKMNKWYAGMFDEIFIGFGKNVGQNVFDQNRISVFAGYNFNKAFRLEGGFLNQTVQLGRQIDGKNVFQYNNGVLITGFWNL